MADNNWPTPARRGKRGKCGCGAERAIEVQIKAQKRGPGKGKIEQMGSISRTLCEKCALEIFHGQSRRVVLRGKGRHD